MNGSTQFNFIIHNDRNWRGGEYTPIQLKDKKTLEALLT